MNSEVYRLNKASKKRSRIEQLLLVDHSDIYFENDKLGDRLNRYLLQLRKDHHKSVILRDNEIKELNRELESFQAILRTSELGRKLREDAEKSDTEISEQKPVEGPESKEVEYHSSLKRRLRALTPDADYKYSENHKVRIKSSLEIFQEEPINIPRSRSLSPPSDKEENKPAPLQRSQTFTSGVKTRKLKEHIDTSNFPQEWFTTVVPASDAVLARVRRHKSAPLHQQLKMLRKNKKPDTKKEVKDSENDEKVEDKKEEDDEATGLKVICDTPVRPVVMSLRQLKEIANIDNLAEKVPNKHEVLMKERIVKAKMQFDKLENRCKIFVENIIRKTEQDFEEINGPTEKTPVANDIYAGVSPPS